MRFCRRYIQIGLLSLVLSSSFLSLQAKSGFEIFGDAMQVLPFITMAYSYAIDDFDGVKQQALGSAVTFASTHVIKQGFVILSRSDSELASISQRPNNGSYNGFPSGHTSFAFSAVGFAHKRYGWKFSVPLGVVATLTGASRVYAQRHTTEQVVAGAVWVFLFHMHLPKNFKLTMPPLLLALLLIMVIHSIYISVFKSWNIFC
ncbi:phosphatase PAP2 family protein [uncultured Helicobacter sp.]|uniref:phosphatase PAP2 family protein n=1 Tax=uncultured Helicobacter sp. TaxID=175537 RepID=UPI00374F888B